MKIPDPHPGLSRLVYHGAGHHGVGLVARVVVVPRAGHHGVGLVARVVVVPPPAPFVSDSVDATVEAHAAAAGAALVRVVPAVPATSHVVATPAAPTAGVAARGPAVPVRGVALGAVPGGGRGQASGGVNGERPPLCTRLLTRGAHERRWLSRSNGNELQDREESKHCADHARAERRTDPSTT
eukprot:CAMPEP_0204531044 /NCGR_PEP_ID=MMETSP0661-20131031/10956_1 /ASSEMBLY_ACC=CAM_ASM_000606 /TAXON_ID=109239 /ORGANISM="Alexandrium margalefi, Strain AMGDE01CS-322" /LENGTH=182 /DNA_ID=CAMNT_0051537173 /DNA_START=243 /DNA_END=792 /DNA_ORIENTATION=-